MLGRLGRPYRLLQGGLQRRICWEVEARHLQTAVIAVIVWLGERLDSGKAKVDKVRRATLLESFTSVKD